LNIRVLGSAAGGGFPQWNCGCGNCRAARGPGGARPRTQEQLALSADGDTWFLLNASPELRSQIESSPPLHPRAPRHSPIAAVILTNGDLDHCLGLFSLREWQPLRVYATRAVYDGLMQGNVIARTLERFEGQILWVPLVLGERVPLLSPGGAPSALSVEAVAAPGKLPIHLEGLREPSPEDNVGLLVRGEASGATLAYFPAVAGPTPGVAEAVRGARASFFDGTFWSSDELPSHGLGDKRAEDMAHWPVGGPAGSLAWLSTVPHVRRIFIHINNTNPILMDDSVEARQVRALGVEVAHDGMEVSL
jgi:pyrroloquinoline quinone biosynthesis protein B